MPSPGVKTRSWSGSRANVENEGLNPAPATMSARGRPGLVQLRSLAWRQAPARSRWIGGSGDGGERGTETFVSRVEPALGREPRTC